MKDRLLNNTIHPTAIIDSNVVLGNNNIIGPYTVIQGKTFIGNNNIIEPHVVIGSPGQDTRNPRYNHSECVIKIGNNNIIKEFTSIQKPCYEDITYIGNDVFLMQGTHIPHDAHIYDKAVITPHCVLAGISKILEGANVGMASTINQYTVIGQYSIVGTNSACMKNVRPFSRYIPNKPISVNYYAIKKFGFENYIDEITAYVMENKPVTSPILVDIIDEFNSWVEKYGHDTY